MKIAKNRKRARAVSRIAKRTTSVARRRKRRSNAESRAKRHKIADAVRRYIEDQKITRPQFEKMVNRGESTMNHFFAGDFSDSLLARVEYALGRQFSESSNVAPAHWGGYTREGTADFAGSYLTLRNDFDKPKDICAYVTRLEWGPTHEAHIFNGKLVREPAVSGFGLVFREERRVNSEYTHRGQVWIPTPGTFLYLVTAYGEGRLRAAIASLPDEEGNMTGIQLSQYNPKGAAFTPAASPIAFLKRERISDDELGAITESHQHYKEYRAIIAEATEDVVFALPQTPPEA